MKNKWYGTIPTQCEVCGRELKDEFIDGKTKVGFWATMCLACHKEFGVGLGIGRGQKFSMKEIKGGGTSWMKVSKKH